MNVSNGSIADRKTQRAWTAIAVVKGRGPILYAANLTTRYANHVAMEHSPSYLMSITLTFVIRAQSVDQTAILLSTVQQKLIRLVVHAQEESLLTSMGHVLNVHSAQKTHQYQ